MSNHSGRIAQLNDLARTAMGVASRVIQTPGIAALAPADQSAIREAVEILGLQSLQRSLRRARFRRLRAPGPAHLLENRLLRQAAGVRQRAPRRSQPDHARADHHAGGGILMGGPEQYKPEVPRRIAIAQLAGGRSYELWRTPEVKPGWYLDSYQGGVRISHKPMPSELRGRIEFERKVEEQSSARGKA